MPDFDIGLMNYPIFDESHRKHLNNLIISHYADYEIGLETPALFKYYLNLAMLEIMPYYNQLYKSEKYTFDPYNAISVTDIETGTAKGIVKSKGNSNTNTNSSESGENEDLFSNTPQSHLDDVKSGKYLTSARFDKNSNKSQSEANGNTSNESETNSENNFTRTRKGNENSDLLGVLEKLRKSFLNIDMMIVNSEEIKTCFMPLWG